MTAQTHVAETDDLWRLTMEHSPVGMAIVSPAGAFLTVNAALCDMLGYEPDVLATLDFQSITHPDDLASDLRLLDQTIAGDISSYRITKRYICADGTVVIGDLSVALLRAPDGSPVHFISQVADITERHAFVERLDAAEAAVEAEQRRTEALFESVAAGLLQVDADGAYLAYNNRLSDILDLAYPRGHDGHAGPGAHVYDVDLRRLPVDELPSARAARGASCSTACCCGSGRTRSPGARCRSPRVRSVTGSDASPVPWWPTRTSPTSCGPCGPRTTSSRWCPTSCVRR